MAYSPSDSIDFSKLGSENDAKIEVISANGQDSIDVPSADFTIDAAMTKDGSDLVLEAPDGSSLIIEGYFTADPAPVLNAPNGASLTPDLVNSFAKSPSEFAQNGSLNDESPVGEIEELSGAATVTRTDGTTEDIQIGTPIYEGDIVETNADGAVNIVFVDETSFAVSENARMAIDEYVYDPATESGAQNFSVLRGVFVFTSGLIGRDDPDDVEIDTPVGSIGIRGTIIAGDINPDGESEITVIEGAIVVTNGGGEAILSDQFETVKIDGFNSKINNIGAQDANDVGNTYNAVKGVSPTLFSTIEDAANDAQSENVERTESQEQEATVEENAQETLEAEDSLDGETEGDGEGTKEPILQKLNDAPEQFDGKADTFDGRRAELRDILEGERGEQARETLLERIAEDRADNQTDDAPDQPADTAPNEDLTSPEVINGGNGSTTTPTGPLNLNNVNADGVTVISDGGIGNRIGSSITSGFFNADGKSDIYFANDTNNTTTPQHHNYFLSGTTAGTDRPSPNGLVESYSNAPALGSYADDVLANIGDIDGDGKDDFAQGFKLAEIAGNGRINIYSSTGTLDNIHTGDPGNALGNSISTLGDIDRDGYDDFIVGTQVGNKAYIGLGNGGAFGVETLHGNGTAGFGSSVTSGDFNGDGNMDAAVSNNAGDVFISFGDGAGGFADANMVSNVANGSSIHNLGDVNGDGRTDLLTLNDTLNQATVLTGTSGGVAAGPQTNGLNIIGAGAAGDWNGDGFDDFVLVTEGDNPDVALFHVIYGDSALTNITTATLTDDTQSFTMRMEIEGDHASVDGLAYNIVNAGDLNGDGFDDLAIGTPDYGVDVDGAGDANDDTVSTNDNDGRVTIVYGRDTALDITDNIRLFSENADSSFVLSTTADNQTLVDDRGIASVLEQQSGHIGTSIIAGAGDDQIHVSAPLVDQQSSIDGGSGFDTLNLFGGLTADFTGFNFENINGIEQIKAEDNDTDIRLTIDDLFLLFEQSDNNSFTFEVANGVTGTSIIFDYGTGLGNGLNALNTAIDLSSSETSTPTDNGFTPNDNHAITVGNNTLYIDNQIDIVVV